MLLHLPHHQQPVQHLLHVEPEQSFRNLASCVRMMETCLEAGQNTRQDYLGRSSALVADRTCRFCSWWTPGICWGRTRRAWQDISGGSHGSHAARTSSCPLAFDPWLEVGSTSKGQFAVAALASSPCLWLPSSSASWCAKMRASGACPPFSIGSTLCWSRPMCSRAPEKKHSQPSFHFYPIITWGEWAPSCLASHRCSSSIRVTK